MDQHDVDRFAGAPPAADRAQLPAEDRPAAAWEAYSLDTLAAILDFEGPRGGDW
jgi:hypothetical protein